MRAKTLLLKLMILLLFMISLWVGFNLVLTAQSSPPAQTDAGNSPQNYDPSANLVQKSFPKLQNIKFQSPASNRPCKVQVKVSEELDHTKARLTAVKLIYYLNGRLDQPHQIKMKAGFGGNYNASIPGLPAGSKVDFIIRAEDSNGNVASQALPTGKNLVQGRTDIDDPAPAVPDGLDLLGISAGYDRKFVYVRTSLQGEIGGGTLDPLFIHVYAVKFTNPDRDPKEGQFTGKAVLNVPLVKSSPRAVADGDNYWVKLFGGPEKVLQIKKTGTVFVDIREALAQNSKLASPEVEFDSQINGNTLTTKVSRTAFGSNPSGCLRIISLAFVNQSTGTIFPLIKNSTNFLILYTSSQSYTVK
ncbi:MAG TPA: hypothetical protein VHY08_14965 [Bacillota bacterium]|nr:hypothetical protein [Bacillota bacterium]